MKENPLGLRKGTWTVEEDTLLRKCINHYGEGKWHLVPRRAGLNRCRKSCRLRWLNYLKPDIKRGQFTADEVDLIIRLHKLLGNRWTLIAGRIPGRTSNDVKNFWNTHMEKKLNLTSVGETIRARNIELVEKTTDHNKSSNNSNIVKPRPLKLLKLSHATTDLIDDENPTIETSGLCPESATSLVHDEECFRYWRSLLEASYDYMPHEQYSQGFVNDNVVGRTNDLGQNTLTLQDNDVLGSGFDNVDMILEFFKH